MNSPETKEPRLGKEEEELTHPVCQVRLLEGRLGLDHGLGRASTRQLQALSGSQAVTGSLSTGSARVTATIT